MNNEVEVDITFLSDSKSKAPSKSRRSRDDVRFNTTNITKWIRSHKKFLIYSCLSLLLLFSAWILFIPEKKYAGIYANSFAGMDPYWQYRHAKNVYEHGYVGDEIRYDDSKKVYWDTFHNAPIGTNADQEFYPYFSAYSYKFFGRFFAPSLLVWHRWTPAIFGILAVLGMFLLVRQLFGPYAGLAAGFLFSLAPSFVSRSVSGFADTDALIAFFSVFTFYFFIKAWESASYLYGVVGGIFLGMFGIAWSSYRFAPLLMLGGVFFFFVYRAGVKFIIGSRNVIGLVVEHFFMYWRKYIVFLLLLVVGFSMIGIVRGFEHVNFFSIIKASTGLKLIEVTNISHAEGEEVRNVFGTVAEMATATFREIVEKIHMAPVLLTFGFIALIPFGLWKRLRAHAHHLAFFSLWLTATLFMSFKATRFIGMLVLPVCIFAGISIAFTISKMNAKKPVVSVILGLILFITIFAVPNIPVAKGATKGMSYYKTGKSSAETSGPVLSSNWVNFFYWARDETPKGSIFASWWDPGHAMTAIGERPSVADGSLCFDNIHDLAIILTATDESVAVERLKKYDITYFYTSSDLINKYPAITFLAGGSYKNYPRLRLSEVKSTASGDILVYPFSPTETVFVNIQEDNKSAIFKQGFHSQVIKKIVFYEDGERYLLETFLENTLDFTLYLDSSFQQAFLLPEYLEKNMLSQLQLFYGQNLEHFELVKNFGDEIKVFKIKYD